MGEEIDVKNIVAVGRLAFGQKIKEQRADSCIAQRLGHKLIAWAQPAAAAAVSEQHHSHSLLWNDQFAFQSDRIGGYRDMLRHKFLPVSRDVHQACRLYRWK